MLKKILCDYQRSGRPKILDLTTHDQISQWLMENNELTINDILLKLRTEGIHVSRSSIGRALK